MTKILPLAFLAVLLLAAPGFSQQNGKASNSGPSILSSATIEIVLVDAPGIGVEESHWNISYEVRIASDAALWDAHKLKANDNAEERVGDLIKDGSLKQTLRSLANRKVTLTIPLGPQVQERLRNQPSASEISRPPSTSKESREIEEREQNLSFYSVIEIYDAKLKKNIIVPITRIFPLVGLATAQFEIRIQIDAEGTARWNSSKGSAVMEIKNKHE